MKYRNSCYVLVAKRFAKTTSAGRQEALHFWVAGHPGWATGLGTPWQTVVSDRCLAKFCGIYSFVQSSIKYSTKCLWNKLYFSSLKDFLFLTRFTSLFHAHIASIYLPGAFYEEKVKLLIWQQAFLSTLKPGGAGSGVWNRVRLNIKIDLSLKQKNKTKTKQNKTKKGDRFALFGYLKCDYCKSLSRNKNRLNIMAATVTSYSRVFSSKLL